MTEKLYHHFLSEGGALAYDDGRIPQIGETITVEHPERIKLCDYGLHASAKAIDALTYAPGAIHCYVTLNEDNVLRGIDKIVSDQRTIVSKRDATRTLHEFAIWCAEQALALVEAPDPRSFEALEVKRRWLDGEASDRELRVAAADARAVYADAVAAYARAAYAANAAAAADAANAYARAADARAAADAYAAAAAAVRAVAADAAAVRAVAADARAANAAAAAADAEQNEKLESMLKALHESE